ncbi:MULTISPECIES: hypothetical protein [Spirulina sp. CCY15215]|nr:hypothetical protein [Spirulina major]
MLNAILKRGKIVYSDRIHRKISISICIDWRGAIAFWGMGEMRSRL